MVSGCCSVVTICGGVLSTFVDGFDVLEQHREFVAAQAREQAARAGSRAQPLGDALQHAIAEVVTERVVDRLEVVHVHEQQRQASGRAPARASAAGEARRELCDGWAAA